MSRQNHCISEMVSQNYGSDWMSISGNKLYEAKEPILIRYCSNLQQEKSIYCVHHAYGEITDHIILFGTKLYKLKEENNLNLKQVSTEAVSYENLSSTNHMKNSKESHQSDISNINNTTVDNDDLRYISFNQLLHNLEDRIPLLVRELEKLGEVKDLLENKSTNENTYNIKKTQDTLNKDFDLLENRLDLLEENIIKLKEDLSSLQHQIEEMSSSGNLLSYIKKFLT